MAIPQLRSQILQWPHQYSAVSVSSTGWLYNKELTRRRGQERQEDEGAGMNLRFFSLYYLTICCCPVLHWYLGAPNIEKVLIHYMFDAHAPKLLQLYNVPSGK